MVVTAAFWHFFVRPLGNLIAAFFVEYIRTLFFCLKNYSDQITDYKTIAQRTQR
jgi:hypothetical protein